ncbi:ATP-binding protein [Nocardiopsis sediminis]|uniref:histidine kinase n=1 Tax=Nocardiopsis sediminis TaxID=1778267 RepID=A0ABV8FS65_9ACTN
MTGASRSRRGGRFRRLLSWCGLARAPRESPWAPPAPAPAPARPPAQEQPPAPAQQPPQAAAHAQVPAQPTAPPPARPAPYTGQHAGPPAVAAPTAHRQSPQPPPSRPAVPAPGGPPAGTAPTGPRARESALITDALAGLAMRDLALVDSLLAVVEKLEDITEDPELLDKLFEIDNLATRMRRNGENLLVLADQESDDPHVEPVPLLDVARAATSEIRDYSRVHIGRLPEIFVAGAAADDISHLLAELLDNATTHSPDHAQVVISGQSRAGGGLLMTVEDEGIGIPGDQLADLNARLSGAPVLDERVMRHMGLYVASRIAHRHGLRVQLEGRAFRGTSAYTVIPERLLTAFGPRPEAPEQRPTRGMPSVAPHPRSQSAPPAPAGSRGPGRPSGGAAVTAAGLPRRSAGRSDGAARVVPAPVQPEFTPPPAESADARAERIRDDLGGFMEGERAATEAND